MNATTDRKISRWLTSPKTWIGAILLAIITAVINGYWKDPAEALWQETWLRGKSVVTGGSAQPSCQDPMWLRPVTKEMLDPKTPSAFYGVVSHEPRMVSDGDLSTAWLQPWPSYTTKLGQGSADYIVWKFTRSQHVELVCVVPGWGRDMGTFRSVLAPAQVTVYAVGSGPDYWPKDKSPLPDLQACKPQIASLQDESLKPDPDGRASQEIRFTCTARTVAMHILAVNLGERTPKSYLSDDGQSGPAVGLTEVTFFYRPW